MAGVLVRNRHKERGSGHAEPHRWALGRWARGFRRLSRPWIVSRHVRRLCDPFSIEGAEHLERLNSPALIIANHTSHFDTLIVLSLLPPALYDSTAVVAAADRFYTDRIKGAWYSLRYNAFPIERGGGSSALAYSEWLLQRSWSLLIFPEGHRSRTGDPLPFHPGPALLALRGHVPVLPMNIQGAARILPPGDRRARPAGVQVRVGPLMEFDGGEDVMEATKRMESAVHGLAQPELVRERHPVLAGAGA